MRSPERISRASWTASRRSVFTRSPAFLGIKAGATAQQSLTFFHAIPVAPVAARSRFVDEDQMFGFGLQLAHEVINVNMGGCRWSRGR